MLSVLVIDDSLTMRKMLDAMFSDMKFNVVATAANGIEGVELYAKHKPDIVTMDVNMPGMSGLEALKIIRGKYKEANIFMLTSRGDNQSVVDAIKYGAKGYILKPLNKKKVEESITTIFPNAFKSEKESDAENKSVVINNNDTSIKDSLTGLYSVQYMHCTIEHLIQMHNRYDEMAIGLLIINIHNLEELTNELGEMHKDILLTQVADKIQTTIRNTDFPIRLTKNEFGVFIMGTSIEDIEILAKKLKSNIEELDDAKLEINVGVAVHKQKEKLIELLERTDAAVVQASNNENKIAIV